MALTVWTQNSGYSFGTISERNTVNLSLPVVNDTVRTLQIGNAGSGYPINGGSFYTTGGSGTGMTVQVFSPSGYLQAVSINNLGVGYRNGDIITILAGGNNATVILNIEFLVTYSVISGKLPPGLRLVGNTIVGTPFEVPRTTEFKFVIRATGSTGIADRTFLINVVGADEPTWLSPAGLLPVGTNNAYYVLDSSFIDFQLSASDTDTATGQQLNFFIASDEGELPPGLILTPTGRITGFVQPLLAIPIAAGEGPYDTNLYDQVAYDFGYRSSNGYDTYVYDLTVYDFSVPTGRPRKLNRNYEFIATITDGDTVTKRKFRIFVVGDDFFRADNVITTAGEGTYTADVTYVRAPIFTTPNYLGLRRANNYQTFKIDIFEGFSDLGPVVFELAIVNAFVNAVCVKEVPSDNRLGSSNIRIERSSDVPQVGYKINFSGEFAGATGETYTITSIDVLGGDIYRLSVTPALEVTIPNGSAIYMGTMSELPPNMEFDQTNAEVFGTVPYQPAITETYKFTVKGNRFGQGSEQAVSRRVFTVDILGEVESVMNWVSPENLGSIDSGYVSTLAIEATSTVVGSAVLYTVESGRLPSGLTLNLDGEIVGKVNQLSSEFQYKSYWKPSKIYALNTIVKQNNIKGIKSLTRRKNIASVVTSVDHDFASGDLVEIVSDDLNFNYYDAVSVDLSPIELQSFTSISGSGPYRVTFSIPVQTLAPLAPVVTLINGISVSTAAALYQNVEVKSTTGSGIGARFRVQKGLNLSTATYQGVTTISLLDPGTGYLPGDKITISGADLGGADNVNDMTFTTSTGLEFYYRINGNSNSDYNGRFFATASTTSSITLNFDTNPGTFGTGVISVTTGPGTYEGQTLIVPLNYFNYPNKGTSISMKTAGGTTYNAPTFYKCKQSHTSSSIFDAGKWSVYRFPVVDKSLTTYDSSAMTFDGGTTTLDKEYVFTVRARDQLGFSAVTRTFTLRVTTPNNTYYSNLTARPFLKLTQRSLFKDFITDSTVFDPQLVYRANDPFFGIQRDLKMLVYAGIETKLAAEYVSAMGRNHKIKRFNFGQVKKGVAKVPGTNDVVYEVIYLEMIDPLEKDGKHLSNTIKYSRSNVNVTVDQTNEFYIGPYDVDKPFWQRPIPMNVTLDRNDVFAGDPGTGIRFPSSISLWRYRIKSMPETQKERNYLPLWMRSIQPGETQEINYVAAVPLCYCKPGGADSIILNIKNSDFDFKLLDYTVDRYIIDSVTGEYTDKYLVFRNDRTTIT